MNNFDVHGRFGERHTKAFIFVNLFDQIRVDKTKLVKIIT